MEMLLYSKSVKINRRKVVAHCVALKQEISTDTVLKKKNELIKVILKLNNTSLKKNQYQIASLLLLFVSCTSIINQLSMITLILQKEIKEHLNLQLMTLQVLK